MLKVHVVRGDGYRYYVDDLVPGRAEGTLVAGESPGVWTGRGAAALGLDGLVGGADFRQVLQGRDPRSGRVLRRAHGDRTVAGYDLTFCAPKSVSLLHLLAPGEMAGEVGAGHRAAVDEAVGYLGRAAVGVRRMRGGRVALLASTGVVAGAFVHRTSRALDPHLHTHLVVANVAQGVDGTWSSVDSRRMFAHAQATQGIYHARLRLELSGRLGVAWDVPPSGLGDVVGVDPRMRRLFSTRTAAMDEYHHRQGTGGDGPGRSRGAFLATRPPKERDHTVHSLMDRWKALAADFGFDLGDLTTTVGLGRRRGAAPGEDIDPARVRHRLGILADRGTRLSQPDLVALVATSVPDGASAARIESAAVRIGQACAGDGRGRYDGSRPGGADRGRNTVRDALRWSPAEVIQALDGDRVRLLDPGTGLISHDADAAGPAGRDGRVGLPEHDIADGHRTGPGGPGGRSTQQLGR